MRLPPLPAAQWDETVQRALAPMLPADGPRDANNALATFAHHPALAKAFLRFNVHLLYSSTLPGRIRELAILRVAHRRDCVYEWTQHVALAKNEGITDDEIAAVRQAGEGGAGDFDAFERAVLTGVDELIDKSELSDADLGGTRRAPQRPAADGFRLHGRLLHPAGHGLQHFRHTARARTAG